MQLHLEAPAEMLEQPSSSKYDSVQTILVFDRMMADFADSYSDYQMWLFLLNHEMVLSTSRTRRSFRARDF